jgi:uncharacterized protein (TIGR00725 family)
MTLYIGVIGESVCDEETRRIAERVGRRLAESGAVLVCGGVGGVMEAASRGATLAKGVVLGIIPGSSRKEGNPYLSVSVVTGMGEGRNIILVRSCNAIIAIGGSYGTLSEIAFAHKLDIPVVGINTWTLKRQRRIDQRIIEVPDADEAVGRALELAQKTRGRTQNSEARSQKPE